MTSWGLYQNSDISHIIEKIVNFHNSTGSSSIRDLKLVYIASKLWLRIVSHHSTYDKCIPNQMYDIKGALSKFRYLTYYWKIGNFHILTGSSSLREVKLVFIASRLWLYVVKHNFTYDKCIHNPCMTSGGHIKIPIPHVLLKEIDNLHN